MKIKVGSIVKWTSQSGGHVTKKLGKVVAIVPVEGSPYSQMPDGFRDNSYSGYGIPRDHVSYLVQVGKSKRLYWPLVKNLEVVK